MVNPYIYGLIKPGRNRYRAIKKLSDSLNIIRLPREIPSLAVNAVNEGTGALMSDYIRGEEQLGWMYSAYLK
jgi:DNA-binding ferritin-like protein